MGRNLNFNRTIAQRTTPTEAELAIWSNRSMCDQHKDIVLKWLGDQPITAAERQDKTNLVKRLCKGALQVLVKHDVAWDHYISGDGKKAGSMYQSLYNLVRNFPKVNGDLKRGTPTGGQFDSPDSKMSTRS